jgi:hypothetical protein
MRPATRLIFADGTTIAMERVPSTNMVRIIIAAVKIALG